ncbi:MAG: protein meaA [Deltaproteobacteria bacterium]|nr:protein meaA [Deltaproteobacteria bacterium]
MGRPKDAPWLFRTYSGHSSARASNELYRTNLAKGQTGLSIAFDLPTQTGYDADHPLARGEVGKVGVPVHHLDDMDTLLEAIPLDRMNTSMTINATAPWLFALYVALAERRGIPAAKLRGTTQNDVLKEFLSRGTYFLPPAASLRLSTDLVLWAAEHVPSWNPINVCSYHLREAGATAVEEVAFALGNAMAVLDSVVARGLPKASDDLAKVVGRISFFVNAGLRFVEELCKLRAFGELWDEITRDRYGVADPELRRFRYGVQVNSLELTEQQPENNVPRIVLEMLGVVLSRNARARAVQLPAWNEALGLPRPWDQQWSLRIQQIVAYETDLLEHEDLFDGSPVVRAKTDEIVAGVRRELDEIERMGGAVRAIESGYSKQRLVESNARRLSSIEHGEQVVVGKNKFTETAASPLVAGNDGGIMVVDPAVEKDIVARLEEHRARRDARAVESALVRLEEAARNGDNVLPASIEAAKAGATTGEWASAMRRVFGDYRAPTGVAAAAAGGAVSVKAPSNDAMDRAREAVRRASDRLGRRLKILVGKPGLDGHSNGAEQIAVRARDAGMEVVYEGIRLTPEQIVRAAIDEGVHVVGLSVLSGSHMTVVPRIVEDLAAAGYGDVPIVVGGIIPEADADALRASGVRRVYTPKDFDLPKILSEIADLAGTPDGTR